MSKLQFRLFGKFAASDGNEILKGLEAAKDQELLSYLLIHRNQHHSREALAGLLWGENSTDRSKKYLRQALWHLQAVCADVPGIVSREIPIRMVDEVDDGRMHNLEVRVKAQDQKGKNRKLLVSSRQGYYMSSTVPKEAAAKAQ